MRILALDSSAVSASVCLTEDGKLIGEYYINIRQTHSQTLMLMTQELLQRTGTALSDVDVFAVTAGPGSFTGVRIAVSCVKGLALAEDRPCISISTLDALAESARNVPGILCPVMDARCGQVYNALFRSDGDRLERITPDRALTITELVGELNGYREKIHVMGDGTGPCLGTEEFRLLPEMRPVPDTVRYQRASFAAQAAYRRLLEGEQTVSPDELQPIYLRLPQAERELRQRQERKEKSN